jgi:hypothetical protein
MPPQLFRLPGPPPDLDSGYTRITTAALTGDPSGRETGLEFGLLRQQAGEVHRETSPLETAWVLLRGAAAIEYAGARAEVRRPEVFDTPPTTLHVPRDTPVELRCLAPGTEWAVVRTVNERSFGPRLFPPSEDKPEYRGARPRAECRAAQRAPDLRPHAPARVQSRASAKS